MQDVELDTPLEPDRDWLLMQRRVCQKPLKEWLSLEDSNRNFAEMEQSHAMLLKDVSPLLKESCGSFLLVHRRFR